MRSGAWQSSPWARVPTLERGQWSLVASLGASSLPRGPLGLGDWPCSPAGSPSPGLTGGGGAPERTRCSSVSEDRPAPAPRQDGARHALWRGRGPGGALGGCCHSRSPGCSLLPAPTDPDAGGAGRARPGGSSCPVTPEAVAGRPALPPNCLLRARLLLAEPGGLGQNRCPHGSPWTGGAASGTTGDSQPVSSGSSAARSRDLSPASTCSPRSRPAPPPLWAMSRVACAPPPVVVLATRRGQGSARRGEGVRMEPGTQPGPRGPPPGPRRLSRTRKG